MLRLLHTIVQSAADCLKHLFAHRGAPDPHAQPTVNGQRAGCQALNGAERRVRRLGSTLHVLPGTLTVLS